MFEAGAEKGRLRREVMRLSRRRRFFLPMLALPSTSQRGRRRLKGRLFSRAAGLFSKQNLAGGPTEKVNAKVVVRAGLLNQRYGVFMLKSRHKGMLFFLGLFGLLA